MQIVCVCHEDSEPTAYCIHVQSLLFFQNDGGRDPCPGLNPGSSSSGIRGISTQALSFHVDPIFALVTIKQLISHLILKVLCFVSSKTKLSLTFVELGAESQAKLSYRNHWKRKRQC